MEQLGGSEANIGSLPIEENVLVENGLNNVAH